MPPVDDEQDQPLFIISDGQTRKKVLTDVLGGYNSRKADNKYQALFIFGFRRYRSHSGSGACRAKSIVGRTAVWWRSTGILFPVWYWDFWQAGSS